jgi:hypothetical protein
MLGHALALYGRHFGALVLTCALALVPASLLATGAVAFGVASLGSTGVAETQTTQAEQVQEKQRDLREKPPASVEDRDARTRQLGQEALERRSAFDVRTYFRNLIPIAYATAIVAAILLGGLFLAHAALVPLVLELQAGKRVGPGHAWAVVASRLGALLWTGVLAAALVALGAVFLFVPGVVLAAGFSLAAPIVVREHISGRAALERSWALLRCHWCEALVLWILILAFSVLASAAAARAPVGPWRPIISTIVRMVLYPLPLAGLVLLYCRSLNTFAGSRLPDSSARESPGSPPL